MKQIIALLIVISAVATAFCREVTGKVVGENELPLAYVIGVF